MHPLDYARNLGAVSISKAENGYIVIAPIDPYAPIGAGVGIYVFTDKVGALQKAGDLADLTPPAPPDWQTGIPLRRPVVG
jgi:hypothetical protein